MMSKDTKELAAKKAAEDKAFSEREQMNVVIVGHVDHGKSTLVGRMLADTGALPEGKLQQVKDTCERNARPFEYAFLLDALKDEQAQGITIDTARCFFKSDKRDYIIIDAPGHIEFLKNMISGAARAEAAMLLIDANEGIKENSKRHGYMMSFLGIKNITVVVNKMDLVNYSEEVFNKIKKEYTEFLDEINIVPTNFIPVSAREGDNITKLSDNMSWYKDTTILAQFDFFEKAVPDYEKDARMPLQDIYKFTQMDDDRRIFSGRIESGTFYKGDDVIFLPSGKISKIKNVEGFNVEATAQAFAGQCTGFQLETQVYIKPGDLMCRQGDKLPHVSTKFKANIFWMSKEPFVLNKSYKLKLSTQQVPCVVSEILSVLDASELSSISNKNQVDRHDVAECIIETLKPVAFDEISHISSTGRFVIVDNYEIVGGGIILAPVFSEQSSLKDHIKARDVAWERSDITPAKRSAKHEHKSALVVLTGEEGVGKRDIAKALEEALFIEGRFTYFLGLSNNLLKGFAETSKKTLDKFDYLKQLGEMAHILTDAGLILLTSISDVDDYEIDIVKSLNRPNKTVVVAFGDTQLNEEHVDLVIKNGADQKDVIRDIVTAVKEATLLDPEYFL
ncbi:MAG: bifunctional enzyme CysN/CysC [Candidatus Omnitrophota bacterium]|jgi:bifunctional enzyme CysN/CysC